jgi:hypothetical protein
MKRIRMAAAFAVYARSLGLGWQAYRIGGMRTGYKMLEMWSEERQPNAKVVKFMACIGLICL